MGEGTTKQGSPTRRRVADVMTRDFVSVRPDERLDLVEDVMRLGRIRHMPVIDRGRLVGIVSQRDVLAASLSSERDFEAVERRSFIRSLQVNAVMTRDPIVIAPDASLAAAARRMTEHRIGCLPIVENGEVQGVVTLTDLISSAYVEPAPEVPLVEELRCVRVRSVSA